MTVPSGARLGRLGLAATLIAGGIAVEASPAAADPHSSCSTPGSGYYCFWEHSYGRGRLYQDSACYDNKIHGYPEWLWDNVHSWTNMQTGNGGAVIANFNYDSAIGIYVEMYDEAQGAYNWTQPQFGADSTDSFINRAWC